MEEQLPEVAIGLENYASTTDLAEFYDVPLQTVQKAAQRGSIPGCYRILGKYYFDFEVAIAGWEPVEAKLRRGDAGPSVSGGGGFKPGNTYGVGNRGGRPPAQKEEKFLKKLSEVVTIEDWVAIIQKAVEQAKEGEWRARRWLSDYLVGTPVKRVMTEIDVKSRREFELGERAAAVAALLQAAGGEDVIDGTAEHLDGTGSDWYGPRGRTFAERSALDAAPEEQTADSGIRYGS